MLKEHGNLKFYVAVEVAPTTKPSERPTTSRGSTEENIAAWRHYIDALPHLTHDQVASLFREKKTTKNWFFYTDRTAKEPFDWIEFDIWEHDPETGEDELTTYAATGRDAREIRLLLLHDKEAHQRHFDSLRADHRFRNHSSD